MLLAISFGLAIGLAVGTLGGGGSVLAVPILVYALDQTVPEATTASLVVIAAGAVAGGLSHARAGRVCWRHAGSFTAAALPGIALGTIAAETVSGELLLAGFALVMLAAAHATWRKASALGSEPGGTWETGGACPPLRLPRDLIAGAAVGLVTGFFGVGGGFLIVPTLAIALAFTMRTAIGTSLVIITATALLGLAAHLVAGRSLDAGVTATMAAACVAGAIAGAWVAGHVPQRTLGRGFALLVVAIAAYLLVSVTLLGGPPEAGSRPGDAVCGSHLCATRRLAEAPLPPPAGGPESSGAAWVGGEISPAGLFSSQSDGFDFASSS